jgi:hypothetical protein
MIVISDRSPRLTVIAVDSYNRRKLVNVGFEKRREFRQKGVLNKRIPIGSRVHKREKENQRQQQHERQEQEKEGGEATARE